MSELSPEQEKLKSAITRSALIWGGVAGVIAGAVTFWLTASIEPKERTQITGIVAGGVIFLVYLLVSRSRAKAAMCSQCSAAFSTTRKDRTETLVSSEEKSRHEKLEGGGSKLTEWTEEKYDVVEVYACSSCGHESVKEFQVTRRKDEVVREKGATSDAHPGDDVEIAPKAGIASRGGSGSGSGAGNTKGAAKAASKGTGKGVGKGN